jgi:transcription initiation factor TFIID subunit 5
MADSTGSDSQSQENIADTSPQVIEYLVKKGYNRTEQTLRQESSNLDKDGKPVYDRVEDMGTAKYIKAFQLINGWVESNLDIYKVNRHRYRSFTQCF